MKKPFLIILSILLFSSCSIFQINQKGRVHIVVAGLDYSNMRYISNLNGPLNDTKEVGALLENTYRTNAIPYTITYLVSEGSLSNKYDENYPSAENILSTIHSLEANEDDLIVFYYSGHGALYDGSENKAYLVCGATNSIPAGLFGEDGNLIPTWYQDMLAFGFSPSEISEALMSSTPYTELPMDVLFSALNEKNTRSIAIIDSCNSGAMTECSNSLDDSFSAIFFNTFLSSASYRNLSVLASSTANQTSRVTIMRNEEGEMESHSLFTADFLDTLGWAHSSRKKTSSSLGQIPGYCRNIPSKLSIREIWTRMEANSSARQTYTASFSGLDTIFFP